MSASRLFATLLSRILLLNYISLTLSNPKRFDTLSELLATSKSDGIIKGNPLLYDECANALVDPHRLNIEYLNKSGLPTPWFWSRETIDAVTKQLPLTRRLKYTFSNEQLQSIAAPSLITYDYASKKTGDIPRHIYNWYHKLSKIYNVREVRNVDHSRGPVLNAHTDAWEPSPYDNNTCFYHIEKSGSSSVAGMMHEYHFNTSYSSENARFHCQCGFTFIRDPISRFVSGYYTINKLIYWYHEHLKREGKTGPNMDAVPHTFSFYNITGEPKRMREFIENIHDYSFEFTRTTPLEHMMTQIGVLSIAMVDIHYIGKSSQLMEHLEIIKNECADRTYNQWMRDKELEEKKIMTSFGTKWLDPLRPYYTEMLNLTDYEAGDLDPAYLAIADSYDLYQKIVEFYKQDYVCFGFDHDFVAFRNKVYRKLNQTIARKLNRTQSN